MKTILIIHHGRGQGGALVALLGLIEELKKENKIKVLVLFESIAVDYIRKTGVEIISPKSLFYQKCYQIFVHSDASYFSIIDFFKKCVSFIYYLCSKYIFSIKELSNIEFDILYLNSTFLSDWSYAGNKLKKKVIVHVREPLSNGIFDLFSYSIRKTISKYCNKVIAITKDNAQRINCKEKTIIVYDPVVRFARDNNNICLLSSNYKSFLYLGGSNRIKGYEQFVKCLKYLDSDVRVYCLGKIVLPKRKGLKSLFRFFLDPYSWREVRLYKELTQSEKVILLGYCDDVFHLYSNCLALISCFSKPHASLPILEAFSVGTPVIVSDIKGMDEFVSNNEGLFFKNKKPKKLAKAICDFANMSDSQLQLLKMNCKNKYNEIEQNANSVSSIINEL